jgi:hypothetical protein
VVPAASAVPVSGAASRRTKLMKLDSTRGCGRNAEAGTGRTLSMRQASCVCTDTAAYAVVDGTANSRSPSSRCTMTAQRRSDGSPAMVVMISGMAML